MQVYALSPFLCQPRFHNLMIFNVSLQHQLPRHKRRPRIVLFNKAVQDCGFCIVGGHPKIKMLPPDHFSAADKKYLYHRIHTIYRKCQDIFVLAVLMRNFLSLCHLVDTANQVTVLNRRLKLHIFGSLLHFFLKRFQNRRMVSIQKIERLTN